MVDDVFIGVESAPAAAAVKAPAAPTFQAYDVYIDDVKVTSTTETTYTATGIAKGSHVAKVVAVYAEGSSEPAAVPFVLASDGTDDVLAAAIKVYPNPASETVNFGCVVDRAALHSLSGTVVAQANNAASMDISHVTPGIYLLNLELNGNSTAVKLIVK